MSKSWPRHLSNRTSGSSDPRQVVGWRVPLFLSGIVLFSQAFRLPSPVRDACTGSWVHGFSMAYPLWQVVFTPFCGLADTLTMLSVKQAELLILYVLFAISFISGRWRRAGVLLLWVSFLAWAVLVPRPMGRLVSDNPDILLIDFHSHTLASHDGRPGFTPEANMRWHQAQGYHAAFITDHNREDASKRAKEVSRRTWRDTGYRSLEGEEASLLKTHLVILGNHESIDNRPYDSDAAKIPVFVRDMHQRGVAVIASIPEYWLYHWPHHLFEPPAVKGTAGLGRLEAAQGAHAQTQRGGGVGSSPLGDVYDFVRWGIDGFEIINSAPKALDFPPGYRRYMVELCRKQNLPVTGISDNHGYGYATAAWNAMLLPGWQALDPDQLEKAVLRQLKDKGFNAVQVLERARYNPENTAELLVTPFVDLFLYWRSLHIKQAVSWVAWIWLFCGIRRKYSR